MAESFFASLKKEQFKFHFYETVSELEESLSEYIDFYNDYRPHECLKQQTPNQFEESYQQQNKGESIRYCPKITVPNTLALSRRTNPCVEISPYSVIFIIPLPGKLVR